MRNGLSPILAMAFAFMLPAAAQEQGARAYVRVHTVALSPIAEPGRFAIVSDSSQAGQYDSRTFIGSQTPHDTAGAQRAFQNIGLGERLRAGIAQALMRGGYDVVPSEVAKADATLDVAIPPGTVRYSDAVLGDALSPSFEVTVRLVDARNQAVLFSDRILYGLSDANGAHALYPDARYRFSSPDALLADPETAAQGFLSGVPLVANEIGKMLAK